MTFSEDPFELRVVAYVNSEAKPKEALAEIVELYSPLIMGMAAHMTNPVQAILETEDLYQCGIMGLMASLGRFEPSRGVPFRPWAIQRIRGSMQDAIRKAGSVSRNGANSRKFEMVRLADIFAKEDDHDPIDLGFAPEMSATLKSSIYSLSVRKALVLLLRIHGMSDGDIAAILDVSKNTISHDRRAATVSLRDMLVENMGDFV